ncbi:hypothetical protein PUMCH_004447 [Australozyma saopauloensis]|uniref:histidine kinase n=1 Tax=Australozyma saopauloensis TaxID=291208 RepID=A0AAX4HH70_9ASCO|nr:hypothetical protein PUMCH_004447 [[Candida] saopauloensis]
MSNRSYRGSDNTLSYNGSATFRSQTNSVSKLSSGSSSSVRFEALSIDHFRLMSENMPVSLPTSANNSGTPNNSSQGLSLDSRKSITKERLLAYLLYVDDINFVQDQRNYLQGSGPQDLSLAQTLLQESFNVASNIVPGYTLLHRLSASGLSSLCYVATHDASGALAIIRLSPDISECDHVARFVNDWYLTLGLNPPLCPRLWTNKELVKEYINSPTSFASKYDFEVPSHSVKPTHEEWRQPLTLPKNVNGVLYPIECYNVVTRKENNTTKRMAMVYLDFGYKTIRDYYNDKSKPIQTDKSSLNSGSVKSVLSELSAEANPGAERILTNNLGSGEFDDLANRVRQIPKSQETVYEILVDMIELLHTICICHELGIVHNGITSHHILRSTISNKKLKSMRKDRVVLTGFDFGFSVVYEDSFHAFRKKNLRAIDDLLPYMSPENTGDAVSLVNYSTDIYSVGIVLYELIVGCLPFQSDNPVRLRKMHLSQRPIQPYLLGKSWITLELNNIIMKCLEKKPQDRYISAAQLQHDLRRALKAYASQSNLLDGLSIETRLAAASELRPDLPVLDTFPIKMHPIKVRDSVFDYCYHNQQASKLIVVKGGSGVGKTTIIEEMAGQAVSRYDFVIPWSYDCSDMNVTKYASLIYGIHTITRQILSSSTENISEWRHKLTNEIDTDLSILFQAVPDLKLLLGPHYLNLRQEIVDNSGFKARSTSRSMFPLRTLLADEPGTEYLTPREAQLNLIDEQALSLELKYKYIFKKFFNLVSQRGLTIILDDVQWCPKQEMEVFYEIIDFIHSSGKSHNISILASYHTNKAVSKFENKRLELRYLEVMAKSLGILYKEFQVDDLEIGEFTEYLGTISLTKPLGSNPARAQKLYDLTLGNRLSLNYISRFYKLKNQFEETDWKSMVSFAQDQDKDRLLQLLIDKIIEAYIGEFSSENVVKLLKFAAITCVNGLFKMSDLMIVTGFSLLETHKILQLCMETKLFIPSGIYYKLPFHLIAKDEFPFELDDSIAWNWTAQTRYRFDHNVIHFNLLKQLERDGEFHEYHRLAGLRLKKSLLQETAVNISDYLSMASHILMSIDVAREKDFEKYYEALVSGGRYAIATSNLELALKFFTASQKFIPKSDTRRLLKGALTCIQCNYLLKNFEDCINLIQIAEEDFGKDNWILVHLKVRSLFNARQFKRGMKKAVKTLQALDVEVYLNEEQCRPLADKLFSLLPLSVSEIRVLKTLKKATDPKFILIAELIMDVLSPSYVLGLTELRKVLLSQLIHLMIRYGYTNACGVPLIHLANMFVQKAELMSIIKASELSDVAIALVNSDLGASSEFSEHLNESYVVYMAAFRQPLNELMKFSTMLNFDTNTPLKSQESSLLLLTTNSFIILGYVTGWTSLNQALLKPVDLSASIEQIVHNNCIRLWLNQCSIEEFMEQYKKLFTELTPDLEFCYLGSAVLYCATVGKFNEGAELVLDRAYHVSRKLPISLMHVRFLFFSAMCLCFNTSEHNKSKGLDLAKKIGVLFDMWTEACYQNFGPELKIIKVSIIASTSKKPSLEILDQFEEAIEAATVEGKWLELALSNHACAIWLLRTSESKKRVFHFANEAYSIHRMMNLDSQAEKLKAQFSELFASFNWAGVQKMPDSLRLRMGVSKAFSDDLIQTFLDPPDYSPATEDSIDFSERLNAEPKIGENSEPLMKAEAVTPFDGFANGPTQDDWTQAIKLCLSISQSSSIDSIVLRLLESCLSFAGVDYGAIILNLHTNEPMVKAIGTVNNIYKLDDESLISRADLVPYNLVIECFLKGESINKDDNRKFFAKKYGKDAYYANNMCSSVLCVPIKTSTVIGAVYLERHVRQPHLANDEFIFDKSKLELLELLCSQAAVSFSKLVVYNQMELAKKAAEDATEEKASFLANMSHEIRTPFNSLFACSIFLLDTSLTPSQREYVETIKNSALVTLNIIDGILAFSKIEHGSFTLDNSPFSINDSIESSISISSDQIETKDIEFVYFNRCPEIESIYGDATRVRQIIINLVGNALKFTSEGYVKVTLSAEIIRETRYELKISVEDTGIGIPDASKSKIFGAFSQVDGSSRRVHGGSGLGLAISKKLAEIMNGRITFTSEFGKGSTFEFSCPFEVELQRVRPLIKPQTVCLVSKAELKKQSIRETIEFYGAKTISYCSLEEAVESGEHFDVILIDRRALKPNQKVRSTLKDRKVHIVLIVRFGLRISDTLTRDLEVDTLIFSPLNRSTTRRILENTLVSDEGTKTTQVAQEEVYPLNILIAEDNPINLRVALQHLKKLGYIADHAKDGVQVLEKCESRLAEGKKYDVILMDIQMPKKDGIEAAIELRKSFMERNCEFFLPQIVALTANVAGEDREKCLKCGMVDFVSKPILPDELKRVLLNAARTIQATGDWSADY